MAHLGRMLPPLRTVQKTSITMRRPESLFGSRKLGTDQEGSFSHVPVVFRVRTLSDSEEARPADRRGDPQLIRCGPPAADLNRTKSRSMTLHLARGLSARRHARPSSAKARKKGWASRMVHTLLLTMNKKGWVPYRSEITSGCSMCAVQGSLHVSGSWTMS